MSKAEFKEMEKEYNIWLHKHPKGDHSYKSFSHMRRSLEFAKYYHQSRVNAISDEMITQRSWVRRGVIPSEIYRDGAKWFKNKLLKK